MEKIEDPMIADEMHISPGGWFVGMPNIREARCYAFQPGGYLDVGYVNSHLFNNDEYTWADAEAVTQLLGQVMQRPVRDPWPKCKECGLPIDPANPYNKHNKTCVTCEYKQKRR